MECMRVAGILTHSQWQDFISSPLSHTILFTISVLSIACHNLRKKHSWLVDVCACILLLVGMYARLITLNVGVWPHDCQDDANSKCSIVSDYFLFSVTSWVCIIIIDAKSCYYILSQPFWRLRCPGSFTDAVKTFVFVMLGSVSVILWLCFCTDVHKTFEYLTSELLLIIYYIAAAYLKVTSVFLQRVYFNSYIMSHSPFPLHIPNVSPQDRKFMCRMAIVNIVEIFHVLGLMWFGVLHRDFRQSITGFYRVAFLGVEIVFKLYISCWYFRNSCLYKRCRQLSVRERLVAARAHLCQTMADSIAHCLVLVQDGSVAFLQLVWNGFTQFVIYTLFIPLVWVVARILQLILRPRPIILANNELVIANAIGQGNVWGELVPLHLRPEHGQEEAGPHLCGPYDETVIAGFPSPLVGARGTLVVGQEGWYQLTVRGACLDVYKGQVVQGEHTVDIALIRWSHTKRLFVPCLGDHHHLYHPLHTTATFPAPCVQETRYRVAMEMLVGGQK